MLSGKRMPFHLRLIEQARHQIDREPANVEVDTEPPKPQRQIEREPANVEVNTEPPKPQRQIEREPANVELNIEPSKPQRQIEREPANVEVNMEPPKPQRQIEREADNVEGNMEPPKPQQKKASDFLPVHKYREGIVETIRKSHVTLISGTTGCGKTTQVAQMIYDDAVAKGQDDVNILISQPRKIAAITNARRVAAERDCKLGELVGYQVGLDKQVDTENHSTKLLFCTTGVILHKLITDKSTTKYSHIILDEIHERELDLDLLVTIIKQLLLENSKYTKIVLMSATMSMDDFVDYFTFKYDIREYIPSVIEIKADRIFNIEIEYLDSLRRFSTGVDINYDAPGIAMGTFELAKKLIKERLRLSQQSILVFLPGIYEIQTLHSILMNDKELLDKCLVCVLHSSLSSGDQKVAFMTAQKPKIVLSTNIAESSVTINNVDCVLDFCLTRYNVAKQGLTASLVTRWASQNSLEQRAGRTGRTCDGMVYRFINQSYFKEFLMKADPPEMERCPLETTVLRIKKFDVEPPKALLCKAMSPPADAHVDRAILVLKELGALERLDGNLNFKKYDGNLTFVGRVMAALPLDVRVSKLIIMGYIFSVLEDTIIIAAGLNITGIFQQRYRQDLKDFEQKLTYADGSGCDFIAILNAYKYWKYMTEQGHFSSWQSEKAWCEKNLLERKSLHEMRQLIREIKERLAELQLNSVESKVIWEKNEKPLVLKICFAGAFLPNFYIYGESEEATEVRIYKDVGWKSPFNTIIFKCKDQEQTKEVYAEQIKERMVQDGICKDVEKVKVTVDKGSSKTFVEFLNDVDKEDQNDCRSLSSLIQGNTVPEVYKALKLAKMGYRLSIKVMKPGDTHQHALRLGALDDRYDVRKIFVLSPELVATPSTCTRVVKGIVTHIDHLSKFYVQPTSELNLKTFGKVVSNLHEEEMIHGGKMIGMESSKQVEKYELVVALHNEVLKRAKVTSVDKQTITCFMIDYGNTEKLDYTKVFKVPLKHFDIPQQCFEASLSELRPSPIKCSRGKWTTEAIAKFSELVGNRELQFDIYSVFDDVTSVVIYNERLCVNSALVKYGYAKECLESFPRKDSHFDRLKNQSHESREFSAEVEFKRKVDAVRTSPIPHPPRGRCIETLHFGGPSSPLETSPFTVLAKSYHTNFTIGAQSVNSILLLDDPANFYGRLMVSVNEPNSSKRMLYDTSVMPDIAGLPIVLAMIFAPNLVFQRNEDKTRYKYLKFGLGAPREMTFSYFPDHDCVLPVNIKLEESDFVEANTLRLLMSKILDVKPLTPVSDEEKVEMFTNAKIQLMKILSKKRLVLGQPDTCDGQSNNWLTDDKNDVLALPASNIAYPPYPYVPLKPIDPKKARKLIVVLKELERNFLFQYGGQVTCHSYVCPLCNREVLDLCEMQHHFETKMHKNLMISLNAAAMKLRA